MTMASCKFWSPSSGAGVCLSRSRMKRSSNVEFWKDSRNFPVVDLTVRLSRPGLQQRETRRCRSNEKSRVPLVYLSDEEIEMLRMELLERYFLEGIEAQTGEDDKNTEGLDSRSPYTMGRFEEDLVEKQDRIHWWMKLDLRSILTPRARGILLLNILTFLYGRNIAIIKTAGTTMDPTLFTVGRFAIASMVSAPFLSRALTKKNLRNASVELGLWASAGYLTQCVSVLTSDAARVSFISTFTVIVVPLFAGLSGAKISKITWLAAAAALFGVGFLESNGSPFAIGDVCSFLSAVMFGVHMLRTEHHSSTLSHEDSLPVMALQLVVITMCSCLWCCSSLIGSGDLVMNVHGISWQKTAALPWVPMLYTGLFSTAFCLWSELVSLRDIKATEAAVIYTTEPLWGAAFAWITLGERWGPNGWLGAFFILGGSLTMQLFGASETLAPKKVSIAPTSIDRLDFSIDDEVEKAGSIGRGQYHKSVPQRQIRDQRKF